MFRCAHKQARALTCQLPLGSHVWLGGLLGSRYKEIADSVQTCKEAIPSLIDELSSARVEVRALKVTLFVTIKLILVCLMSRAFMCGCHCHLRTVLLLALHAHSPLVQPSQQMYI